MIPAELHAHVFMDGYDYRKCVARFRDGVDKAEIRSVLSAYQSRGITLVRDGGDHFGACLYAKSIAGEYGITYLMPSFALYKEGNYGKVVGLPYADAKEFHTLVSKAKGLGADFIKIMVSGILDFDQFGLVTGSDYTLPFVKELVQIAHDEGFAVMTHASGTENVRIAAEAGVDSIEHGYYMDQETMDILAEKKILWVPSAVTCENLKGTGRFCETEVEKIADTHKAAIAEAFSRGVIIGCGSDAGAYAVHHGSGCLEEYELLKTILGDKTDSIIREAEEIIRRKFSVASLSA